MSMINGTRLYDHLTQLGRIGFVPKEGTTRLPYTPAYDEGRIYVQQCMEQAGLQTSVDPVGNLIGTLPGQGEIICIGSHIDTVPGGGIYDGTYGVLSGIECVQRLKELGYQNRHPIQVIAFTEEEGNVIGGTFGSKAFTGGEIDEAMRPNLALHGLTMEQVGACRRDLTQYQCYLELHIEQGGVLEAERMQIGVVDGIVGIVRYRMTVSGCANHAGSTPMHLRDDALVKACRIITQLMERTEAASPDMVCTVGTLQVFPGAVNVIPGKVEFIVELRNPTMEPMDQVIDSVLKEHPELVGEEYIRQSPTLHGLTMEQVGACRRDLTQYQCYLELHIEQGGVLEAERMQIGVVDGIVGIVRYRMTVSGCANHAGSTPMHLRDDALVKACRIITQLMERTEAASPDMVCTVGTLQVFPGAVNVIPGKVEFIVELRNPTMEPMDQVIDSVLKEHPELVGEEYIRQSPTQCSSKLIKLSETLCRNRGIRFRRMFSGAGHDLMNWGKAVPSMLLFIPSKDGISHSIREYSAPEDLYQGADLLMEMVQALDQEEGKL